MSPAARQIATSESLALGSETSLVRRRVDSLDRVRRIGWVLLGCQLAAMLVLSTVEYDRGALTHDFGAYSQAWWEIARGNLDPWSSLLGTAFWRNNAELAMWPLSVLYYIYPHPISLLWLQDVVVVATELAVFGWILEVIGRARNQLAPMTGPLVALGALVMLLANPWTYETIAFEFHFEPFTALFVVLAGRDLWAGRTRRLWLWAPLALMCDALGGVFLVGVGLSGILAGRQTRRPGLALACAGFFWILFVTAIGGSGGTTNLGLSYGYLVGPHSGSVGLPAIIVGVFGHLGSVVHVLLSRWAMTVVFLLPVGIVGVLSPWGFGMTVVTFVPPMLVGSLTYFRPIAAFQIWPALPFALVGSVMVALFFLSNGRCRQSKGFKRLAIALCAVWAVVDVGRAIGDYRLVPQTALAVDQAAGLELASLNSRIPERSELIVQDGLVGRFADRTYVFYLERPGHHYSVRSPSVYFVISPTQGLGPIGASRSQAVIHYVTKRLNGSVVAEKAGVLALEWHPNSNQRAVVLP
jgi:uncharacterized membrane protein